MKKFLIIIIVEKFLLNLKVWKVFLRKKFCLIYSALINLNRKSSKMDQVAAQIIKFTEKTFAFSGIPKLNIFQTN